MEPTEHPLPPAEIQPELTPEQQHDPHQLALHAGHHLRLVRDEEQAAEAEERVPDTELIEAHKSQARSALEKFFHVTKNDVYTLAHRLTGSEGDAQDIMQDVYRRVQSGLHNFRGDAKVSTWLYRTTLNSASTFLGRRSRYRSEQYANDFELDVVENTSDERLFSRFSSPEEQAELRERQEKVAAAISRLPAGTQKAVTLRYIYDLSFQEVGKQLGISENAAKVRAHRGFHAIKKDLENDSFFK
jgi:RNA polymerase sigma-70 factor (ECF subfamily)